MRKFNRAARRPKPSDSFSLVELLVVMAIIAILASLILAAGTAVINKGLRSRTSAEIQAMSTAAEGYKTDNGIYPQGDGILLTNSAGTPYSDTTYDGTSTEYQTNSTLLYIALSAQTNFATPPAAGTKVYMSFKVNQVGNPSGSYSYIMDPWTKSYGYSTGTPIGSGSPSYPYTGNGFFDLWSTAGVTTAQVSSKPALTNTWLGNWMQ
jgi:prepilin-type N-terminal cleavage/methylation domain-containing protein